MINFEYFNLFSLDFTIVCLFKQPKKLAHLNKNKHLFCIIIKLAHINSQIQQYK